MIKVVHERDICIGCGACAMLCPKNWVMNADGKADLKPATKNQKMLTKTEDLHELEIPDEELENNEEAESSCPVLCIHVKKG